MIGHSKVSRMVGRVSVAVTELDAAKLLEKAKAAEEAISGRLKKRQALGKDVLIDQINGERLHQALTAPRIIRHSTQNQKPFDRLTS